MFWSISSGDCWPDIGNKISDQFSLAAPVEHGLQAALASYAGLPPGKDSIWKADGKFKENADSCPDYAYSDCYASFRTDCTA